MEKDCVLEINLKDRLTNSPVDNEANTILTLINAVRFDFKLRNLLQCLFNGRLIFVFCICKLSTKRQHTVQMLIMGASAGLRHLQTNRDSRPIGGMEGKPIHFSVSVRFAGAIVVAEERKTWKITKHPPSQKKSLNFYTILYKFIIAMAM